MMQVTDQRKILLFPESETRFFFLADQQAFKAGVNASMREVWVRGGAPDLKA
jgi:hypothetical protein